MFFDTQLNMETGLGMFVFPDYVFNIIPNQIATRQIRETIQLRGTNRRTAMNVTGTADQDE